MRGFLAGLVLMCSLSLAGQDTLKPVSVHPADSTALDVAGTALIAVPDTVFIGVPDTSLITVGDTILIIVQDTILITVPDTALITVQDTILITIQDTALLATPDTAMIAVQDTALLPLPDTLCIIGTGDIMLGTNYPSPIYLPPGEDCSPLLSPVHHVLQSGDLLFGNLEGVFCGEGGTPKACRDTTRCYVFRMPDHFASCLVEAGYDVMSVANNHVNDFGEEGRAYTSRMLDSLGIAYAGFTSHPWTVFEKGGITYGFAAFAPNKGTMSLTDYEGAARITRLLDSISDVVIISFHGGAEGSDHQHVVHGDEEYLGVNRGSVYRFAHTVVDAGADVVFGHGPHVTRAIELYSDRLICYSLGNFATYRRFNLRGPNGIAPIVKTYTDRSGKFLYGEVVPIRQTGEGGARIDPDGGAIKKLIELNGADFPEQSLVIGENGSIRRIQ